MLSRRAVLRLSAIVLILIIAAVVILGLNRRDAPPNPRLRLSLRTLLIFALLAGSAFAAEPDAKVWPLWDGQESVAEYAQRVNLPPTKTLDLGNGVNLELVLIPAGEFIIGTPDPEPVDEEGFRKKVLVGQALLAASGGVLLVLVGAVVVQAIRRRRRPQYSLARFLAMIVAASGCVLSELHWRQSAKGLEQARSEYAAKARYDPAYQSEKPAHSITLTRPFYMGKWVVTQQKYVAVIGANPSGFKGRDNPVETVSWDDAQAYCKKLAEQTKQTVRLPTEAEWEYACRAGTTTTYHSGDAEADLARVAWYAANSKNTTHPVGQKEPNAFGLYDMHGNVWQWCQDWYGEDYYGKSEAENPQGPAQGAGRVLRGGSWYYPPGRCRAADRIGNDPDFRYNSVGFRVVVVPALRTP